MMRFQACWILVLVLASLLTGCSQTPEEQALALLQSVGARMRTDAEGRVISVDLSETNAGDAALAAIGTLPHVQSIHANGLERITGSGLAALGSLQQLDELYLAHTRLDDAGLAHLARLTSLTTLQIGHTKVTDAGMPALDQLHELRTLSLADTAVTDRGLVRLRDLRNLTTLNLRGTQTTRGGVQELRRMLPQLRVLD